MRYILQKVISFYQVVLSPLTPGVCRFHPSCSHYSREAVQYHGVAKGLILTILRLARCNPLFKPGLDPVPSTFTMKSFLINLSTRSLMRVSRSENRVQEPK